jgi:ATP-dependent Lon protease
VRFSDAALRLLIGEYTREAGVRNLEREIGAICRKLARRIAEERRYPRVILPATVREYLGAPRYARSPAEQGHAVGVATGLSWTINGGDIMAVEVTVMPGKGQLVLTGQLGDVMRESAQAALSYARSNAAVLGIERDCFERSDIHVHVPQGAVPKDGPSAGVTLATAMISALNGRAVRCDVAMTGEITLRGRVLAVGGIKEKVLGAHRAGIATVLLPRDNAPDLDEVPGRVRRQLRFVQVEHIGQVLETALSVGGQA